ncbi:MAG: hypothetical protein ACOX2O_04255 [Bdellovibrionota bacterium]|jgi:hypothetical protein
MITFFKKRGLVLSVIFLMAVVAELFIFNASFLSHDPSFKTVSLDLRQGISEKKLFFNEEGGVVLPYGESVIEFRALDLPINRVEVSLSGAEQYNTGVIELKDAAFSEVYNFVTRFNYNPASKKGYNKVTAVVRSFGKAKAVRFKFNNNEFSPLVVKSIILNGSDGFSFSYLRTLLLFCLGCFIFCCVKYSDIKFDPHSISSNITLLGGLLFCLLISVGVFFAARSQGAEDFIKYPLAKPVSSYSCYVQQFDAFLKGQFHIDRPVDPKLKILNNPYDKSERDLKQATYPWDLAYYKGHFYSYFGIAPLLTVHYPVYFFSKTVPSDGVAVAILTFFGIFFIFFALHELTITFCKNASLCMLLSVSIATVFSSLLYTAESIQTFYYLPVLSSITFLAGTVAFTFFAYNTKRFPLRILSLILAAISCVLVAMSRPHLLFIAFSFIMPIIITNLLQKERKLSKRLLEFISFVLPLSLGGLFVMYYNYVRFDSVFQFGQIYQLTVSDVSYFTIRADLFLKSLFTYFLQIPNFSTTFPYLMPSHDWGLKTGSYIYRYYSMGALWFPINLAIFVCGYTFNKNNLKKITFLSVLLSLVFIAFVDFCLGGVHLRYVSDLALSLALLSSLTILSLTRVSETPQIGKVGRTIFRRTSYGLCLLSIFVGFVLVFSSEGNAIKKKNPDIYLKAESFL